MLLDIVARKCIEFISGELDKGKRRGYISLRGLEPNELGSLVRLIKNLGLRAGVANGGIWWAVPKSPTKPPKK